MIRSAAVTRIQRGLGFRSDQEANIISSMQEAQRLLERGTSLPYFLLEEDQSIAVTSGTGAIDLPERFLREKDDEGPYYTSSENKLVKLEKVDFDIAKQRFFESDPGRPLAYVLRKDSMLFFPERDTSYTLTWSYYKGAAILSSDIENGWLEEELGNPEALIGAAGYAMASDLRNASAQTIFKEMFQIAWKGGFADSVTREEVNLPLTLGGKL